MRYPAGATRLCRVSASSPIVSAVRLATTTVKACLIELSFVALSWTFSTTRLTCKFSEATFTATGSLSIARISLAPNSAKAMASIPEPVPTSKPVNLPAPTRARTISRNSIQARVVAWVPVPKAMPGSIVITCRRRKCGGVSHGGVTQKLSPTRRGLMKRFHDCCQFSCWITFHRSRGWRARTVCRA